MGVQVTGVIELKKALRNLAPDLSKELNKELGVALKPVIKEAKSFIPSPNSVLSGWLHEPKAGRFPYFDFAAAKSGIKYKTTPSRPNNNGFRSIVALINASASGAIFETAGRKNPQGQPWNRNSSSKKYSRSNNPNAGRDFIAAAEAISPLQGRKGDKGRAIGRALENNQGAALNGVMLAIQKTSAKFKERIAR